MKRMSSPSSIALPFAIATAGIALFSGMDALMKGLALEIGAYNALLWRNGAGALLGAVAFFGLRTAWPAPAVMRVHLIRGVLSSVMALLFFWGLARLPMAQAIALTFVAPLIALYLAAALLGERIERRAILASLLGLAGVLVILSGHVGTELGPDALAGAVAVLSSACLYAYNIILMRKQALVARPVEIAFFMSLIMLVCFLLAAPLFATVPAAADWPHILGAALLGFMSLILLSWAYARAQAQHLAPVEYTAFVWAALFGFLVFGEGVRAQTLAGAGMIVLACIIAARRRPGAALEAAI